MAPLMVGLGSSKREIVAVAEPEQPAAFVTVTVTGPVVVTVFVAVVDPPVHAYELKSPVLNVVDPPGQNESMPIITGTGRVDIVVVADPVPLHPFEFTTVSLNP